MQEGKYDMQKVELIKKSIWIIMIHNMGKIGIRAGPLYQGLSIMLQKKSAGKEEYPIHCVPLN